MILDKGFCTIYKTMNIAEPGEMPKEELIPIFRSWYGELNFETSPIDAAAHEGVIVSNKIRIIQNREVTNHHVAVLSTVLPPPDDALKYNVVRAYHGIDDENGQLITDLSLERLVEE